jgi:hypothetical protein
MIRRLLGSIRVIPPNQSLLLRSYQFLEPGTLLPLGATVIVALFIIITITAYLPSFRSVQNQVWAEWRRKLRTSWARRLVHCRVGGDDERNTRQ